MIWRPESHDRFAIFIKKHDQEQETQSATAPFNTKDLATMFNLRMHALEHPGDAIAVKRYLLVKWDCAPINVETNHGTINSLTVVSHDKELQSYEEKGENNGEPTIFNQVIFSQPSVLDRSEVRQPIWFKNRVLPLHPQVKDYLEQLREDYRPLQDSLGHLIGLLSNPTEHK